MYSSHGSLEDGDGKEESMGQSVISLEKSKPLLRAVVCLRQYLAKQRHLPKNSWLCIAEITDEMRAKKKLKLLA